MKFFKMNFFAALLLLLASFFVFVSASSVEKNGKEVAMEKPTERNPSSYYSGLMILCEGYVPRAQLFTSPISSVTYYISSTCTRNAVYGSYAGGSRYISHSSLWRGFQYMNYFYEDHYNCGPSSSQVSVKRKVGTSVRTVFECDKAYEAHVVYWRI